VYVYMVCIYVWTYTCPKISVEHVPRAKYASAYTDRVRFQFTVRQLVYCCVYLASMTSQNFNSQPDAADKKNNQGESIMKLT